MTKDKFAYLLDAGNTHVKLSLVQNSVLSEIKRFTLSDFPWEELNRNIPAIVSSVIQEEWKKQLLNFFQKVVFIDSTWNLPFKMDYQTPETLGIDRLCNVAGLAALPQHGPKLSVDLGTCIKFDLLKSDFTYDGGSISPGLQMRAKALQCFTAKLPLIPINTEAKLIGRSTQESIESGVFQGWTAEIQQLIERYKTLYPDLQIYLTGGDARYFDFDQKSNIFALEHLTLEGILAIYRLNENSI